MSFGKINTLLVYGRYEVDTFRVGQKIKEHTIAEIKDVGMEFEDSIFSGYDLINENGNTLARFENGSYATYFDDPKEATK
jgi:hypothetical protein